MSGRLPVVSASAAEVVGDGEDGAEVVGGVAPLGGEPGVVVVQPADERADVEGGLHGVELVAGAGNACAVADIVPGHEWAEELGAGGEVERLQAAAEGVEQAVARGLVGERGFDLVVEERSRRCRVRGWSKGLLVVVTGTDTGNPWAMYRR